MKTLYLTLLPLSLLGDSISIINPSGEYNTGVSPTVISNPDVLGWEGQGQVIKGQTDYGNGGWRMSFEDAGNIRQLTNHVIESGASYSLRFDAAPFSSNNSSGSFNVDLTLVGAGLKNGDFNADTSTDDSRSFAQTPEWTNLGTSPQTLEATRTTLSVDGTRNAVVTQNATKIFAIDTGHTLATGEVFQATYQWRDASNWVDASDRISVSLFTTADNTITGTRTVIQSLLSDLSTQNNTYETEVSLFNAIPASANGKKLFCSFVGVDGNGNSGGFARLDNFTLQRGTPAAPVADRELIADLYIDNAGTPQIIATRTYDFKSNTAGVWHHYHLAVPAGTLDAHVGKNVGIRFRSNPTANSNFQSVDNVRLDYWPTNAPDGSFSTDWNTSNRTWAGPGYWANRLQDWELSGSRVKCVRSFRERRTLHRVGTSIRGNGADFTLNVTTGINTGTASNGSRSGFLIGAAPNLDWRGALLVQDALGRDFGLVCGIRGDGAAIIEDYMVNTPNTLALGTTPATLPTPVKLQLVGTYDLTSGNYDLVLTARNSSDQVVSTASASVSSDRLLGSFGLLSHKGSTNTAYWFDNFSGTGEIFNPEPDRHLAILGAMYTLNRGTMQLVAQHSPVNLGDTAPVTFETWDGTSWNQIATAAIDNTDNLSSFTSHFKIANWDNTQDTNFRLGITVDGEPYHWTGTILHDPVEKTSLNVAVTTCQRIADGNVQNDGFDWSPVRLWQPHAQLFDNIEKQDPDILLALGDQIYEGQPTQEDSSDDFIRQHDYLYKWYLWVLQARELTRKMPTICMPDDHDVFQGNLWGEGGKFTTSQNTGGYEEPASWVKMVERTQTLHLPDTDPYNPTQPAPPVLQDIPTYFTHLIYGQVGFAILEDRKFKTGSSSPPADPNAQFLLGTRQKQFLNDWADDWNGQCLKCVVSQSPFGNLHTHANTGYNFGLNDKDSHGWPVHRRNEAWGLLRKTRMFQIAGDQHVATVAHHGINGPADAGYSFTAPAVANFFPRCWDPVHNTGGRISTINPYKGDFFFDGNGTLPTGQPNLTAQDPAHVRLLAAANPLEYHNQTRGISPANLHDRGAGYGMVRIDKTTRQITFEAWPIHADPDHPNTGTMFPDWPITINQTDNDGRQPTGYLPLIETQWRKNSVVRVYDESSGELIYSYRLLGNIYRPPVYDNTKTYRVEISHGDEAISETLSNQIPATFGPAAIHRFTAIHPSIIAGNSATLQWDVENSSTLTIDNGIGDVITHTIYGIGQINVTPTVNTTYTLTLNGTLTKQTLVRVYPAQNDWLDSHFSPDEQANPAISGNDADPDNDGLDNWTEFLFQTDPRASSAIDIQPCVIEDNGQKHIEFQLATPILHEGCLPKIETSFDLINWLPLPTNSYAEISRNESASPTTTIRLRVLDPLPDPSPVNFYRASWQ